MKNKSLEVWGILKGKKGVRVQNSAGSFYRPDVFVYIHKILAENHYLQWLNGTISFVNIIT